VQQFCALKLKEGEFIAEENANLFLKIKRFQYKESLKYCKIVIVTNNHWIVFK